jgi:hypothetical protein
MIRPFIAAEQCGVPKNIRPLGIPVVHRDLDSAGSRRLLPNYSWSHMRSQDSCFELGILSGKRRRGSSVGTNMYVLFCVSEMEGESDVAAQARPTKDVSKP